MDIRLDERGPSPDRPPQLSEGLEALGAYQGSGAVDAPYLVRKQDGGMVAVSRLLYLVMAEVDGRCGLDEIAVRVSAATQRTIIREDVAYVIDHKLRPLGLIGTDARGGAAVRTGPPASGLAVRSAVIPERIVASASGACAWVFRPAAVVAVLGTLAGIDTWLVAAHPITLSVADVVRRPGLVLAVCLLTALSGAFHELGHAAGCSYGGARPGRIGVGIYLVWPVFFSDLTDSYRLNRRGRLRSDLGGLYFNALFILLLAGIYGVTGQQILLVAIALQHVMMLRQLLPFLRLDGYYIVSDLAGVPDLFGRIRPVLAGLVPGRSCGPAMHDLKPKVRALVTAWVLGTTAATMGGLVLLGIRLPAFGSACGAFLNTQATLVASLMRTGDAHGLLGALRLAAAAIPVSGLAIPVIRIVRRRRSGATSVAVAASLAAR